MKQLLEYLNRRVRNYGFWLSLFSLIPLVIQACGYELIPNYDLIVNIVLMILVALGITNNPTSETKWYGDYPKNEELLNKVEDVLLDSQPIDEDSNEHSNQE